MTFLYTMYDPFLHNKPLFRQKFIHLTFFSHFVLSRAFHNTTSPNIGGWMPWPSPTSNFGGTVPLATLSLRPCSASSRKPLRGAPDFSAAKNSSLEVRKHAGDKLPSMDIRVAKSSLFL